MNSPQPSTACPPRLAAWFLRHSRYTYTPPSAGLIFFAAAPPFENTAGQCLTPIAASMTSTPSSSSPLAAHYSSFHQGTKIDD
jgi:hypothetical protein